MTIRDSYNQKKAVFNRAMACCTPLRQTFLKRDGGLKCRKEIIKNLPITFIS